MLVLNPTVHMRTKLIVRIFALLLPLFILIPFLSQAASARPTTYIITDGDQTTVLTTNETDPEDVLAKAGLRLNAEDIYTTAPGENVSEITIQRSQSISINYCGTVMQVRSYGETLESLLTRLGLSSGGNYIVSLPLETKTYDQMTVQVDHVVHMEQTYTEEIPFETVYCADASLPKGTQKVLVSGSAGQMRTTADVVYKNSVEQSRTVFSQTVISPSVDRVIAEGTGDGTAVNANAPAIGDGVIVTADGEVLTYRSKKQFISTAYTHTDSGCDTVTATGTTVRVGTVAVDPSVVPYGTRMFIVSNDGQYVYGLATAEDCGSGVKGHHLDLYFPTEAECWEYGSRNCTVYFLD